MEQQKFEKRIKGIEFISKILFLLNLLAFILVVAFKIFYDLGVISTNNVSIYELFLRLIILLFLFICIRLARHKHIAAGIIGIVLAMIYLFFGNVLYNLLGILLGIDSIMYLVYYRKLYIKGE